MSPSRVLESRLRAIRLKFLDRRPYDRDLYGYRVRLKSAYLPRHLEAEAVRLYSAWKRRVKGRSLLSALKVAALLKASRAYGYPLYLEQALEMFPSSKHRLTEALAILGVEPARPETFIPLIVSRLPIGEKGRVVAAAIIYQSCRNLGLKATLRSVARAAGVSESSVRGALRSLARFKSATDCDAEEQGGGPDGEGGLHGDPDAGGKRGGSEEPQAGG